MPSITPTLTHRPTIAGLTLLYLYCLRLPLPYPFPASTTISIGPPHFCCCSYQKLLLLQLLAAHVPTSPHPPCCERRRRLLASVAPSPHLPDSSLFTTRFHCNPTSPYHTAHMLELQLSSSNAPCSPPGPSFRPLYLRFPLTRQTHCHHAASVPKNHKQPRAGSPSEEHIKKLPHSSRCPPTRQ